MARAQDMLSITGACGPAKAKFSTRIDATPQPTGRDPQRALVYFFLETTDPHYYRFATVRVGLDGQWAGAYRESSWIAVPVSAGEHKVCALADGVPVPEIMDLNVEPGKTYFLRTREITTADEKYLMLDQMSQEQWKYVLTRYPATVATLKP